MIEKLLESAIVAKLRALSSNARIGVDGFWQPSAEGTAKGAETPAEEGVLRVVVKPRAFETFTTPKANFSVALALVLREETDPARDRLAELVCPIFNLMQEWQESVDTVRSDLTVDGFAPSGLRLDGGDVRRDDARHSIVITQSFTIRGTIQKGK